MRFGFSYLCPRARYRLRESQTTSLTSLPFFINTFRFAGWAVFLSKSFESKSRRLITYQFYLSLSYQFGCQQQQKMVMKLILVANVFKWVDTRPKDRL